MNENIETLQICKTMNPEVKAAWVDALRSGDYRQTDSYLKWGDRFCCLGVLCDLGASKNWSQEVIVNENGVSATVIDSKVLFEFTGPNGERNAEFPPNGVLHRAGLTFNAAEALAQLNDDGASFEEIADYIEEHL